MLERIKNMCEKISKIIQAIVGIVLSVIVLAFVGPIVIGFITLYLSADFIVLYVRNVKILYKKDLRGVK